MSTRSVVGLRDIAAAFAALDSRLDQVAALGPGWAGPGSRPVDPASLRAVRAWGQSMPGWALVPAPAVVPLPTGGVQLEWHDGPRVLELEFETPDTIHFLKWDPGRDIRDEDTFPAADRGRAEELIGWLLAGATPDPLPCA